ncbi:Response regulator receiver domain-containing protein [Parapedobacter composti]|uniref:Response regulator receiver domain-containing protein n=1 Tax=Parapedobacter composti TaxID=623281 RepID=A0A1I1EDJ2_9SPHI|nr:response regulator [Parapedobacter composti]SFB85209.1 Response regulator receiver domain-containing protein [Parapedobacter composti]
MKKAIHVLEDDADISELIAFLLAESGYEASIFNNIASFKQHGGKSVPALLIIDIMLPDGNGLDICNAWKTDPATKHIPILLMSAYDDYRHDVRASKANGFISKPFDIEVFMDEVGRQLGA